MHLQNRTVWEYMVVVTPSMNRIIAFGIQGWELCGIHNGGFYFKREVTSSVSRVAYTCPQCKSHLPLEVPADGTVAIVCKTCRVPMDKREM